MRSFKESYNAARQRVNPEGLIVGTAISAASNAFMIPMETGITYAIHEATNVTDPTLLKIAAVALLGIANAISIRTQARALREKEYSASPVGSTFNIITGKPLISAVGEHAFSYGIISVFNPINAAALVTNNNELLMESLAASSIAYSLWSTSMNTLILQGKIDPVVNKIRSVRESISLRFKK